MLENGKVQCGGQRGLKKQTRKKKKKKQTRCPHCKGCVPYTVISMGKMCLKLEYFRLTIKGNFPTRF